MVTQFWCQFLCDILFMLQYGALAGFPRIQYWSLIAIWLFRFVNSSSITVLQLYVLSWVMYLLVFTPVITLVLYTRTVCIYMYNMAFANHVTLPETTTPFDTTITGATTESTSVTGEKTSCVYMQEYRWKLYIIIYQLHTYVYECVLHVYTYICTYASCKNCMKWIIPEIISMKMAMTLLKLIAIGLL